MLKNKQPPTSLEDGLTSALTCFGIDAAHQSGQVVDLRPLWQKCKAAPAAKSGVLASA
jgi:hypothetical protein